MSKWNATVVIKGFPISGNSAGALESEVHRMFDAADGVTLTKWEQVNEHLDLPLVAFSYPTAAGQWTHRATEDKVREVRVTKMDDNYIEGFEGNQFKKFLRSKVSSEILFVQFIPKKD